MAAMAARAAAVAALAAATAAPVTPRPASSATRWMTRFRSSLAAVAKRSPRPRISFTLAISLIAAGCASSSGAPATAIAQPDIAAAYLPLHAYVHLGIDSAEGAAVVIAPGIAVTN